MKAFQICKHGVPAEVVELVDIPEPDAPQANEVLVGVEYAPINQSERLKIMGRYPVLPASFPSGVGNEGVARILSVGRGVAGLKPGDRVLVPATHSAWRERILLPTARLFSLPASADPQQLSMLSINPPTAAMLLCEYVNLKPGDWVIQNAGNSGVGRSVIAIAKSPPVAWRPGAQLCSTPSRAESLALQTALTSSSGIRQSVASGSTRRCSWDPLRS